MSGLLLFSLGLALGVIGCIAVSMFVLAKRTDNREIAPPLRPLTDEDVKGEARG